MNNGAQGGQPGQPSAAQQQAMMQMQQAQAQAQAQGQQPKRQVTMFRPEQMRALPDMFTAEEKAKWEQGLRQLWGQIEKNPSDSPQHTEAKRKLFEFSKTLTAKLAGAQRSAQQAGAARPPSQGQPQQTQGEGSGGNQNAAQQPRPQPKISPTLMDHVSKFPYVLPPQLAAGTPDAAKWLQDAKSRYLKALVAMESTASRVAAMDAHIQKRKEEGNPLSPEDEKDLTAKREQAQKGHAEAKQFVDNFRAQQAAQRNAQNAAAGNQQGNTAQQGAGNAGNNAGQPAPVRPQMSTQQPNPALQNTQTVNAAIEAARNQQMNGGRPQGSQGMAAQNAPSLQNMPQQTQNIKTEAGVPSQINTAVTQMQQGSQGRPNLNSPQSAVPRSAGVPQSATSQAQAPQIPTALSHSDALHQAARSYSTGQASSSNVMGHSHPSVSQPRESQNIITNKMPIPKHLPDRAAAPPQPVPVPGGRPTLSGGPSNAGNGVLSQPVIARTPGFNMEGEGDRVLSKKKLDELVRQVTGGGQGEGEGLAPDVEEVCFHFTFPFLP
jgi:transcription initiation factor TFIID subunit 12